MVNGRCLHAVADNFLDEWPPNAGVESVGMFNGVSPACSGAEGEFQSVLSRSAHFNNGSGGIWIAPGQSRRIKDRQWLGKAVPIVVVYRLTVCGRRSAVTDGLSDAQEPKAIPTCLSC